MKKQILLLFNHNEEAECSLNEYHEIINKQNETPDIEFIACNFLRMFSRCLEKKFY